eukprot:jgi/Chlat1/3869/Chrsp26S04014
MRTQRSSCSTTWPWPSADVAWAALLLVVVCATTGVAAQFSLYTGPRLGTGVIEASSAPCGGRLIIAGGYEYGSNYTDGNKTSLWDLNKNSSWTRGADIPIAMSHGACVCVNDTTLVIIGGFSKVIVPGSNVALSNVWAYDIKADRWLAWPSLPAVRGAGTAFIIRGRIYFVGGAIGPTEAHQHARSRECVYQSVNNQA